MNETVHKKILDICYYFIKLGCTEHVGVKNCFQRFSVLAHTPSQQQKN